MHSIRLVNHSHILKKHFNLAQGSGEGAILEIVPFRDGTMPPVREAISVITSVLLLICFFASLVCPPSQAL